jgi:acid phosphatase
MSARLACLLLAATLAGCASTATLRQPSAPGRENLNAVAWMQASAEHDLVYREVFRSAGEKLLAALADPAWDALPPAEREVAAAHLPPAVIVDIDETVLDNSPYQARLVLSGKPFEAASWSAWCREASARALPGAVGFAQLAARHGVTVFYLSNRSTELSGPTLANLRAEGFPLPPDREVFLGRGTAVAGCIPSGGDKGCRRRLVGRGYRVLLQVGDQLGDFIDVDPTSPAARAAAVAPSLDWIGERWFVLPNPSYGDWEAALLGGGFSASPAELEARKMNALDTNQKVAQ